MARGGALAGFVDDDGDESRETFMKFVVVQVGARRGYAVPAFLERAGMLERFYTDLAGNVGLGRGISALRRLPGMPAALTRLASRQVPPEVCHRTHTFGAVELGNILAGVLGAKGPSSLFRRQIAADVRRGKAMSRAGFGGATHLFTMLGEGGPFVAEAHRCGLTVVAEVYILLTTERIMAKERCDFPDWEPDAPDYSELRRRFVKENVLIERTHSYICPSEAVQDDLVDNWKIARDRTALVPYGVNPQWLALEPSPQRGRVLFVGSADLRKGIHYLAMAAEKLRKRGRNYEFRVAGNITAQVRRQPVCRHLTLLGRVPRDRIHEEFQQADVFVLPSLAEGSAEATYEALAAGVPLVVTKAAGSVARDGVEGRIVFERDFDALADAIEHTIENRAIRDRFARAARERAREFTWEKYGERLVQALSEFGK
jgi:glycosyltransferase involved in cell wall biosynthesis